MLGPHGPRLDQLDPARTSRLALGAGEHMLEIQAIDDTVEHEACS